MGLSLERARARARFFRQLRGFERNLRSTSRFDFFSFFRGDGVRSNESGFYYWCKRENGHVVAKESDISFFFADALERGLES